MSSRPPPSLTRRKSPAPKPHSPPRLRRLIYILIGLTALLCAYYSYRFGKSKQEVVAGLRKVASLRWVREPVSREDSTEERDAVIEMHMKGLAYALGIPVGRLAAAIANAISADLNGSPPDRHPQTKQE
ncbi:hypothetical protein BDN70DRAFT_932262 [Pholiota conissans]|uniref:Uncharacterized protein n=1 Tax=Pholiota conissans TaxID=109636 RepID=A0A9P5Z1Q5_9AGAR|nr:hypothetical protein BDN70DRAFT_932262 [Pholiota conissans]